MSGVVEPRGSTPLRDRRTHLFLGWALVLTTLGIASAHVLRGRIPFTSDQAIPALMAMDILDGSARPVFYYGVEYGGAVEPYLLAAVYRVVGPSTQALRALLLLLLLAVVLGLWRVGSLGAGRRTGAWIGVFAALAPVYLYYKVLTSDGAYASLTCAGVAILLVCAAAERRLEERRSVLSLAAALGIASGLAFWIHLAAIPYLAVAVAAFFSWVLRGAAGVRHGLVASTTFLLGSLPWWMRNIETKFASLRLSEASPVSADVIVGRLGALVSESLPILLGPSSFRGLGAPAWAIPVLVLAVGLVLADGARGALRAEREADRGLCRLSLTLVATSVAAFLLARNTAPWEPRYLLPALVGIVILAGRAFSGALEASRWRCVLALVPLAFAVSSHARAPFLRDFQRAASDDRRGREVFFASARDVLGALERNGVRSIYGSYWSVYRLVFLSGRAVAGAPFGRIAVDRIPELTKRADTDASPAFLLDGEDLKDMETYLAARGFSADRTRVGGVVLYTNLPAEAVSELRAARRVPR